MKKISVIIPTIRPSGLLEFQLPALANQTMPKQDWELVLIDDYPDSREKKVGKFADEHGMNVKWMRSKPSHWRVNAPIGCARNTGLIHAEGELIVFFDDYSWVKPEYLSRHWKIYDKFRNHSLIGPVVSVKYAKNPPKDISKLEWRHDDSRKRYIPPGYGHGAAHREKIYVEKRETAWDCPAGWFFSSNASAPLEKIVELNGFWEMADMTREEDILMGLALERIGWKFFFINALETSVFHMDHGLPELEVSGRYKPVTFEDLGWEKAMVEGHPHHVLGAGGHGRCGLDTEPHETQLVTKDVFNTKHPGSWALIQHFRETSDLVLNEEIGFNLMEEREKIHG